MTAAPSSTLSEAIAIADTPEGRRRLVLDPVFDPEDAA